MNLPLRAALLLLTFLFTGTTAMATDFHDHEHDLYCNMLDDGTVSITFNEDNENYNSYSGYVNIPDEATLGALHPQYIPITEIGQYAFRNCYDLTGVSIGGNVKNIGFDAFWNCTKLTELDIPDNVLTIDYWAFENCSAMTKITLGSGLTSIGGSAFSGCSALRTITCNAITPPTITNTTFPSTITSSAILYVPTPGAAIAYQNANYWSNFATIVSTGNYDFVYNGIYYAITSSNTVSVTNNGNYNTYSGSITIPATVTYGGKTYKVTDIGPYAFRGSSGMTSVTIGSNVTSIQDWAFSYSGLTSVVIPDNVKTIGFNAFGDISTLTQVTIGKGVTDISTYGFDSPLTKVTVLATTPPTIEDNTFKGDTYDNANLIVPKGCESVYESATNWSYFRYVYEVIYDFYVGGIYYKKTSSNTASVCRSIDEPSGDYTGTVTIPATVTYNGTTYKVTGIDANAFCLSSVTKVNIGSNVTTIGSDAFLLSGLTSITIPNNVTSMGKSAFEGCNKLQSASIGTGITTISECAFMYSALTSITIPNNVKTIEKEAFHGCSYTTSLSIGSGVTTIGEEAFNGLNVTTITIPDNVKTIGKAAFYYCDNVTTLTIGSGVTSIGNEAFYECNALTTIKCNAITPPTIQSNTFYPSSIYTNATLTVPGPAAVTAYKAANYWKNFTTIKAANSYDFYYGGLYYLITGSNTVSVTFKNTNYNSYTASTITIPAALTYNGTTYRVTAIGDNAFRKCTSVTKVNIGSNVTSIGQYAFYGSGLKAVTIPDNVTTIKANAFGSCNSLTEAIIGQGVTSVASLAFDSPLTSVTCHAVTPPTMTNTNAFRTSTYDNGTLYVPGASLAAYKSATGWRYFAKIQAIGGSLAGDLSGDGKLDVTDVTLLIDALLNGQTLSVDAADVNGDGTVDISDITALITTLLSS